MKDRLILGVAGGSGSGKTTVVEELLRSLEPAPVSVRTISAALPRDSGLILYRPS